jgi:hypothetical protein
VFDHDWPTLATGVAIPHGLYDIRDNVGYIQISTPTILVNWPVTRFPTGGTPMARYIIMEQTRFCSDVMGALAIALPITSSHRIYRP